MSDNAHPSQPFVVEHAAFTARETELTWSFSFGYDAVWEAVNSAVSRLGLTALSADRRVGLTVVKPPFSLLNLGRRIAVTFLRLEDGRTLVRGVYLHGAMCLESRHSRQQTLDTLFRSALQSLDKPRAVPQPGPSARPAPHAASASESGRSSAAIAATADNAQPGATTQDDPTAPTGGSKQPDSPQTAPATKAIKKNHTDPQPPGQQDHAQSGTVQLDALDFRHADFNSLPLTPPTGPEASRYRLRPPLQRSSGLARSAGWFALGLGIAILAFILSDGLSLLME
ncbi:MAG: hypothetical protein KKE73_06430 [Proteobacteria bacterium]|nr:hypothetical protein [Pseudomonadota bacterium]